MSATAVVSAKSAKALRAGYLWVYRQDVESAPEGARGGDVVCVVDPQRNFVMRALWAEKSPVALRMLSRRDEPIDDAWFRAALERALKRRSAYAQRDAFRWVHAEADGLPGLFVDRYGPALVVQTLSQGMDVRKDALAAVLTELSGAAVVVARDDASGRDFEGLAREVRVLHGELKGPVEYHEGPNVFAIDVVGDFKTGAYLDQVDNHLRAGELAFGEALDTFSYHGGFAFALARSCTQVLAIEQDEKAARTIEEGIRRNALRNVEVQNANAFDVLRALGEAGQKFDTVVIDPPGLAKRKSGLATALRAYHELNLRAMKLLRPEGLLISCSCSGKLSRAEFEEVIADAARDAKRQIQVLERRGAGLDHPALLSLPESEYLKAQVLRVL